MKKTITLIIAMMAMGAMAQVGSVVRHYLPVNYYNGEYAMAQNRFVGPWLYQGSPRTLPAMTLTIDAPALANTAEYFTVIAIAPEGSGYQWHGACQSDRYIGHGWAGMTLHCQQVRPYETNGRVVIAIPAGASNVTIDTHHNSGVRVRLSATPI